MSVTATLLWASLSLASPGTGSETESEERSIAGGWLQLAPVGVGVPGPGATPDLRVLDRAVVAGYRWGLSAGLAFEPVEHLLVVATGAFDQSIWMFDNDDRSYELCFRGGCYGWTERGFGHLVRLGAELRLGWTSRYLMAWALLGAHLGLSRIRLDCDNSVEDHCDIGETDLGPGLGGGLGVAGRLNSHFAVGLESSIDHSWLDHRDDPFRAARTWDLSLVAIVHF